MEYRHGKRGIYGSKKHWAKRGYMPILTKGPFDLVGIQREDPTAKVRLIQVKRVTDKSKAKGLLERFEKDPPLLKSDHYTMIMEVQIKGSSDVLSVEI